MKVAAEKSLNVPQRIREKKLYVGQVVLWMHFWMKETRFHILRCISEFNLFQQSMVHISVNGIISKNHIQQRIIYRYTGEDFWATFKSSIQGWIFGQLF